MARHSVMKVIHFSYGHRLMNHDGACRHLHGHNGVIEVDVSSDSLNAQGMVVDFGDVRDVVKGWVDAAGRPLVERSVETVAGGVRFTFDPRLKTRSRWRFTEEQVLAFLAAIDCPVLMVRADSGWPVPEDQMEARLATIPDLTRVEVEGGHRVAVGSVEVDQGNPRRRLFEDIADFTKIAD